jgi:hypothetical protein
MLSKSPVARLSSSPASSRSLSSIGANSLVSASSPTGIARPILASGLGAARGIGGCGGRIDDGGGTEGFGAARLAAGGAADGRGGEFAGGGDVRGRGGDIAGGGDVRGRGATLGDARIGDSPARMREPGGPPTTGLGNADGRGAGTDGFAGGAVDAGVPAAGNGFWARAGGG